MGLSFRLPWTRREAAPAQPPEAVEAPSAGIRALRPVEKSLKHAWLDVTVARSTQQGPVPLPQAAVVVRPWPPGTPQPAEPIARTRADASGVAAFHLPLGRYAVAVSHGGESKAVAVTLERDGRATVLLERPARLVTLAVEILGPDGLPLVGASVEAVQGDVAVRALADEQGYALLPVPPGAYEVMAGGATRRVDAHEDVRVRLTAPGPARPAEDVRTRRYEPTLDRPWN